MISSSSSSGYLLLHLLFGEYLFESPPLFLISLKSSIKQSWSAGVYQGVIIIVFAQVVIPYVCMLVRSILWFLPTSKLSRSKRELILRIMDAFSRVQLVSFFITCIYLISFHFDVTTVDPPQSNIQVKLFVYCIICCLKTRLKVFCHLDVRFLALCEVVFDFFELPSFAFCC